MDAQLRIDDFLLPGTRVVLTVDDAGVYYATWYEWDAHQWEEHQKGTGSTADEALRSLVEVIYQGDLGTAHSG